MKKHLIFMALLFVAIDFAICSCEKENGISIVPQFSGITCNPSQPMPGDSITLTAVQAQVGELINRTSYDWSFQYSYFTGDGDAAQDTTVTKSVSVVYDNNPSDPVIGFLVPANIASDLNVSIHANYALSGQTASGQIYGQATRSTVVRIAR